MKKNFIVVSATLLTIAGAATAYNSTGEVTVTNSSKPPVELLTQSGHLLLAEADDVGACSRYKRFGGDFLSCNYTTKSDCTGSPTEKVEWIRNGSCSG